MNPIAHLTDKIDEQGLWASRRILSRREHLRTKESTGTNLYQVVSGSLRVYVLGDFEEHVLKFGYKNNLIASSDSFISEKPSDLYIQSIKKRELKVIKKTCIYGLRGEF